MPFSLVEKVKNRLMTLMTRRFERDVRYQDLS